MRAAAIGSTALWLASCFVIVLGSSTRAMAQVQTRTAAAENRPADAAESPKPDYTNRRQFGFPVTLDPAAVGVTALQLHYSANRGGSWQMYAEQPAYNKSFPVKATGDGEFWFAVKTVDIGGNVRPAGETKVQRIVVIDTRPPKIDLSAEPIGDGKIRLRWEITDKHLDAKSLKVGFQSGTGTQWQSLPLDSYHRVQSEDTLAGEFDWSPDVSSRVVNLRIEIYDLAKNQKVEPRQLFLPRRSKKLATAPAASATTKEEADKHEQKATSNATPIEMEVSVPSSSPPQPAVPWPINNQLPAATDVTGADPSTVDPGTVDPRNTAGGYGRLASDINPQVQDRVSDSNSLPDQLTENHQYDDEDTNDSEEKAPAIDSSEFRWPKIPEGEPLRMTQTKRFQLDYDIESLGPDVVSEVQLWGTQDGGLTWEKWNVDHDKTSPFDVQVNEEGIYGFRVVIIANNGLAGEVPSSGAPADLWVGYDATQPTAEITDVIYGSGQHLGQLDIRWTASDRRFGERPMALSFSSSPDGPWTTIASALPNSGQYYWEVGVGVPKQIYLRLECYDGAGNSCSHITREPVNTSGVFPRAKIRSVQPVN